jgi:DNA-directed RNA polymerase subunit RPC12/RpoP
MLKTLWCPRERCQRPFEQSSRDRLYYCMKCGAWSGESPHKVRNETAGP